MAEFDRVNPLFERNYVPFQVITIPSNQKDKAQYSNPNLCMDEKRNRTYTVRILQGHRPLRNGGGSRERVIRFEMSNECSLIKYSSKFDDLDGHLGSCVKSTPGNRGPGNNQYQQTPNIPVIHAPFIFADRGRSDFVQPYHYQQTRSSNGDFGAWAEQVVAGPTRSIELYELEVGEADFSDLRRDQALLVDFNDFANSLISLMNYCELGDEEPQNIDELCYQRKYVSHQNKVGSDQHGQQSKFMTVMGNERLSNESCYQTGPFWVNGNSRWSTPLQSQPINQKHGMQCPVLSTPSQYGQSDPSTPLSTYTCRLEIDPSHLTDEMARWRNDKKIENCLASMHARFSIVESNQFRELTHLALNLRVGTDKSVRSYLSSRLGQTMVQIENTRSLLREQRRRTEVAENSSIDLNKRLNEFTRAAEAETYKIKQQVEEQLKAENSSHLKQVNEIKAAKDEEVRLLKEQAERSQILMRNKICSLEEINKKINAEKLSSENEKESLATKFNLQEATNKSLMNELESIRDQLQNTSNEKAKIEKSLHELKIQLASLEHSKISQERTISQTEAQRISAEKVSDDAKQTLSRQQAQMKDLCCRLSATETDLSKYKELASRYQSNRHEMKKRLKEKTDIIREQEEALLVKEREALKWKRRVNELEGSSEQLRKQKEVVAHELSCAKLRIEDNAKSLENNQQVIAWLNKQLKTSQTGLGQGQTAESTYFHQKFPSRIIHGSALSRYLPNSSLVSDPYLNATPDTKETPSGGISNHHSQPTPFSRTTQTSCFSRHYDGQTQEEKKDEKNVISENYFYRNAEPTPHTRTQQSSCSSDNTAPSDGENDGAKGVSSGMYPHPIPRPTTGARTSEPSYSLNYRGSLGMERDTEKYIRGGVCPKPHPKLDPFVQTSHLSKAMNSDWGPLQHKQNNENDFCS